MSTHALAQGRVGLLAKHHRCGEVQRDDLLCEPRTGGCSRHRRSTAGVVDQYVDTTPGLSDVVDNSLRCRRISNIRRDKIGFKITTDDGLLWLPPAASDN